MVDLYLGHSTAYWIALDMRFAMEATDVNNSNLLEEVVTLRGRINYYESRIKETAKVADDD